jgi:hypothetical protein
LPNIFSLIGRGEQSWIDFKHGPKTEYKTLSICPPCKQLTMFRTCCLSKSRRSRKFLPPHARRLKNLAREQDPVRRLESEARGGWGAACGSTESHCCLGNGKLRKKLNQELNGDHRSLNGALSVTAADLSRSNFRFTDFGLSPFVNRGR